MTYRWIVLGVLALAGCKKSENKNESKSESKQAPLADVKTLVSVPSLARADWPTGITSFDRETKERKLTRRFVYGSDAPCTLPSEAQHRGFVGCPSQTEESYGDGSVHKEEVKYDENRRLLDDGLTKYKWTADGAPIHVALPYAAIRARDANVAAVGPDEGMHALRMKVEGGRLLVLFDGRMKADDPSNEKRRIDLVWGARRLERVEDTSSVMYLEYADAPVAEYPEDIERKKREAADHDVAALATVTSLPRDAWPCAIDIKFGDDTGRVETFAYGDRKTCKLPLEVLTEGLVGCPKEMVIRERDADGTLHDPDTRTFRYADDGRLLVGYAAHRWRDDGLAAARGRYERTPTGLKDVMDEGSLEYDLKDGKLVATRTRASAGGISMAMDFALTWDGGKLMKLAGTGTPTRDVTLSYACK